MLLFTLAWSGGVATAQETPSDSEGTPLAVPIGSAPSTSAPPPPPPTQVTPRVPPRGHRPGGPRANPPPDVSDAAHAAAIRQYRDQYLSLRDVRTTQIDTAYTYVPYGVYGGFHRRWGWGGVAMVPETYVSHGTELAVFEGPHRLDVPSTYEALGDQAGLDRLEQRIRTNKSWSNVGYTVALAGIATSVVGLVELDQSRGWVHQQYWGQVTGAGLGLMLGGVIGGAIPSAKAHRLQYDHELSFDLDTLKDDFSTHNADLATQLGLTQTEAAQVERK